MNRRRAQRLEVRLGCYLTSPHSTANPLHGTTVNISRTGLLVRCREGLLPERLPEVHDWVEVHLRLPKDPTRGGPQRCLRCQATVVRIEGTGEGPFFLGLKSHGMKFQDLPLNLLFRAGSGAAVVELKEGTHDG